MAAARKKTAKKKAPAKKAVKKTAGKGAGGTRYQDLERSGEFTTRDIPGLTLALDQLAKLYSARGCTVHIDIMDDGDSGRHRRGNRNRTGRFHIPPAKY